MNKTSNPLSSESMLPYCCDQWEHTHVFNGMGFNLMGQWGRGGMSWRYRRRGDDAGGIGARQMCWSPWHSSGIKKARIHFSRNDSTYVPEGKNLPLQFEITKSRWADWSRRPSVERGARMRATGTQKVEEDREAPEPQGTVKHKKQEIWHMRPLLPSEGIFLPALPFQTRGF